MSRLCWISGTNLTDKRRFMEEKKPEKRSFSYGCYRLVYGLVRLFYPKMQVYGTENLPDEPCIIVGNHTQMNGPIACQMYFPGKRKIWCAGQMMHRKEVPAYAFQDFWSQKPRWTHPFYKLLSHLIAPLSECIFNQADTIPVYRDTRIVSTFKQTVRELSQGESIVIFPEHDAPHNHIVYDFQSRFIDIARLYYKKTGKELCFVPMYIAPALKEMYIGQPTCFRSEAPMEEERERICTYLMDSLTETAEALPLHRVVPYRNIPKKQYPMNRKTEDTEYA